MIASHLRYYLNTLLPHHSFIICNTSDLAITLSHTQYSTIVANFENKHWFVIMRRSGNIYMLDPLCIDLAHYSESAGHYVNQHYPGSFHTLHFPVQTLRSTLCGEFCLYFVFAFHLQHLSLVEIEDRLSNLLLNDRLIGNWFSALRT
jgi:hypothetical protein